MKGSFSQLGARIRQLKADGVALIDRTELASYLDYSDVPRETLEARCRNAEAAVALYQSGYRSFVRGKGYFINPEMIRNPIILQKLCDNAKTSTAQKLAIEQMLDDLKSESLEHYDGQMEMAWDDDGNPYVVESMTREELLEFLRERLRLDV